MTPDKAAGAAGYAARELAAALNRVDSLDRKAARLEAELAQVQVSLDLARLEVGLAESAFRLAEQVHDAMPPAPKAEDTTGGTAGSAHNPMVRTTPAAFPKEP